MKATYNPLKPHKEFVLPEDFDGFNPNRINQIRQMQKNQKVKTDICLTRDDDRLKGILIHRLKKMGFNERGIYSRLAKRTGIDSEDLSAYFNHNRHIWNEAEGKAMPHISETQLLILCYFAGIKLRLDIDLEPLESIKEKKVIIPQKTPREKGQKTKAEEREEGFINYGRFYAKKNF